MDNEAYQRFLSRSTVIKPQVKQKQQSSVPKPFSSQSTLARRSNLKRPKADAKHQSSENLAQGSRQIHPEKEREVKYIDKHRNDLERDTRFQMEEEMKELRRRLAEAHIAREIDEMKIKTLSEKATLLGALQQKHLLLETRYQELEQVSCEQRKEIDGLKLQNEAMMDSNKRLTEMLAMSAEFKQIAAMANVGEEKPEDLRYLRAGGFAKKDLQRAIKGQRGKVEKYHWTYKHWEDLKNKGALVDEEQLWVPERAVDIVREFSQGKYGKNEALAIEKLLFELSKIIGSALGREKQIKIQKLKLHVKRLKDQIKRTNRDLAGYKAILAKVNMEETNE